MIYLDANATTPLCPEARAAMLPLLGETFGNPSSVHAAGQAARAAIDLAREQCARALGARPKDLIFTSGGTEAAQLAVLGLARARLAERARPSGKTEFTEAVKLVNPGARVVISAVEHPAVLGACEELEPLGVETVRVPVDRRGRLDLGALEAALEAGALLVSAMAANNETGVLSPLSEVAALCRAHGVPLHTDAVQLAGKAPLDVRTLGADLASISGHKLEGPKGAGLLWARPGLSLRAVQPGGHQERGRRGGTENPAAIAGLGAAMAAREHEHQHEHVRALRDRLEAGLLALPGVSIVGREAPRIGNTCCAMFAGCDAQTLLVALDGEGICVSTGSACSSGSLTPSPVLLAMGYSPDEARTALRFSLWRGNTAAELERVLAVMPGLLERARR